MTLAQLQLPDETVGVYVTTKNRRHMLERALESVVTQSRPPDEIIVVDDGSEDDTPEFLSGYAQNHPNMRILRNESSVGACAARNMAIEVMRSTYVTGLDDDDEFTPVRIECFLEERSALSEGNSALASSLLLQRQRIRIHRRPFASVITLDDLLYKNHVGNQVFTLTERLRAIGGFDPTFPAMQDYDTWIRLTKMFGPVRTLENSSYIVHMEHESERITQNENRALASILFYKKHEPLLGQDHRKAAEVHKLICHRQRATLSFVRMNYVRELRSEILRYFLFSNFSFLRYLKTMLLR